VLADIHAPWWQGLQWRKTEPPGTLNRMQKLLTLLALLGLVSLAGGCAAVTALPVSSILGLPSASALEIHNQTDVRLQQANFVLTKTNVVGQSQGFALLGLLTIVPADFSKAMSRLQARAGMQPGRAQTLANLVMERNSTYFILFSLPRVSICADVIEFIPPATTNSPPRPPSPGQPDLKTE
jgi:hypothetical protein